MPERKMLVAFQVKGLVDEDLTAVMNDALWTVAQAIFYAYARGVEDGKKEIALSAEMNKQIIDEKIKKGN